jgi:hypothetical protein
VLLIIIDLTFKEIIEDITESTELVSKKLVLGLKSVGVAIKI